MLIESGLGNGKLAGVDGDNRILTASFNIPFEHLIAKDYQKTFGVVGTATPAVGSVTVLLLKNNSQDKAIVLNRLILQTAGITAAAGEYFTLELDSVYASGGTAVVPVNRTAGSAVTSSAIAYDEGAVLTGAPNVIDVVYTQGSPIDLQTDGGIILLPGKGASVGYTSAGTTGVAKVSAFWSEVSLDGYSG